MFMKRVFSIILVLILVLGTFVGCSSKDESVDKIKDAIDRVVEEAMKEENVGDVSKDSKLPKLTVSQLPLENLFDETRISDDCVLVNYHKVKKENLNKEHGILVNVRKNNGVFVLGEFDDIPSIKWNDGTKSDIRCYWKVYSDKEVIQNNQNLTTLKTGAYKDYEYYLYRIPVVDENVDDYTLMIDFGCKEHIVTLSMDYYFEDWGFTKESESDEMALLVTEELLPVLDVHCSCCK